LGILALGLMGQLVRVADASLVVASNSPPVINQSESSLPIGSLPEKNGTYLYGQSPKLNQLGQGYILFRKDQDHVLGALYMPQSEFSCFQGTISKSGNLAMTVTSPPSENGVTEVATASTIPQINDRESDTYDYSIGLKNYYQFKSLSAADGEILQKCHKLYLKK
jgi:hypothetical protein